MAPTNDKPYISKADERYASNKDRQKRIVIWNSAVSLFVSVSLTVAEQTIIDDFDMTVSRGSCESRRRTLLVVFSRYISGLRFIYHSVEITITFSNNNTNEGRFPSVNRRFEWDISQSVEFDEVSLVA